MAMLTRGKINIVGKFSQCQSMRQSMRRPRRRPDKSAHPVVPQEAMLADLGTAPGQKGHAPHGLLLWEKRGCRQALGGAIEARSTSSNAIN